MPSPGLSGPKTELGVKRRERRVHIVDIPPGGVRLPDLYERVRHAPAVAVQDPPEKHDRQADRLLRMLVDEVVVGRLNRDPPEHRALDMVEPPFRQFDEAFPGARRTVVTYAG